LRDLFCPCRQTFESFLFNFSIRRTRWSHEGHKIIPAGAENCRGCSGARDAGGEGCRRQVRRDSRVHSIAPLPSLKLAATLSDQPDPPAGDPAGSATARLLAAPARLARNRRFTCFFNGQFPIERCCGTKDVQTAKLAPWLFLISMKESPMCDPANASGGRVFPRERGWSTGASAETILRVGEAGPSWGRLWATAPSTMLRMVPLPRAQRGGGSRRLLFPPPCSERNGGGDRPKGGGRGGRRGLGVTDARKWRRKGLKSLILRPEIFGPQDVACPPSGR